MAEVKIPVGMERQIEGLPADVEKFVLEAVEERLAEARLERSKAFRKLLLSVFNRMTENSRLTDKDALELGRKVNEAMARKYGLAK